MANIPKRNNCSKTMTLIFTSPTLLYPLVSQSRSHNYITGPKGNVVIPLHCHWLHQEGVRINVTDPSKLGVGDRWYVADFIHSKINVLREFNIRPDIKSSQTQEDFFQKM